MVGEIEVANMSLGFLRVGGIQDFEEDSAAADYASLFFDTARRATLEKHDWTFARVRPTLVLLEELSNENYYFRYQYPTECVKVRGIWQPRQHGVKLRPPPFEIETVNKNRTILTNEENARALGTVDEPNLEYWSSEATLCLAWYLAALMAAPVAARPNDSEWCMKNFYDSLPMAQANDANEQADFEEGDGELITSRH